MSVCGVCGSRGCCGGLHAFENVVDYTRGIKGVMGYTTGLRALEHFDLRGTLEER